jgi:soluble lytic murein transglycosylase-like protein
MGAPIPLAAATSTPAPAAAETLASSGLSNAAGAGLPVSPASQTSVGGLLTSAAQTYGVDPALVKAVAWQESGWQMVVARDGGIGVMQLMPATATWVGPDLLGRTIDPYSLQDNIQAGVALLASYLRQYGGNVQSALAAYNEGPQNVARGIVLPSTAQYIASVLALRARFAQ